MYFNFLQVLHLAAELVDCKTINDFLANTFSRIMTPDLGNMVQWKTRQLNGQIVSGLKDLSNVLAVIKGIIYISILKFHAFVGFVKFFIN